MEMSINQSASETIWMTSVEEILLIFRDGMLALTPIMDRAHISYIENQQYDDYDDITEALYRQIVINSIKHSFEVSQNVEIPAYGFEFEPAKHTGYIVITPNQEKQHSKECILKNFCSNADLFDSIIGYSISQSGSVESAIFSLQDVRFELAYKSGTGFSHKQALAVLL